MNDFQPSRNTFQVFQEINLADTKKGFTFALR